MVADANHRYMPRKILRCILDHALDHLNQIEQWLVWQQQGIVPTPDEALPDEPLARYREASQRFARQVQL